MGKVTLHVKNVLEMKRFYHDVLLLELLNESEDNVLFGHGEEPLVELLRTDEASYTNPTHAGLYHLAILYSSRQELSKALLHIFTKWKRYFIGSADHLVSEAFYFTDPEGNGIELYFDKEKSLWQWENGSVKMASLYIDSVSYIQAHHEKKDAKYKRTIGHVHLKVGNIAEAKQFYVEVLGFDITAELPGALFLSRDGYHHHLGMNSWESGGAKKRTEQSGLKSFELRVHSQKDFETMQENLLTHAIAIAKTDSGISFHDPWNNQIQVSLTKAVI